MRDSADRSDRVEMCMAAKAQCMQTGVHVGPYSGRHYAGMARMKRTLPAKRPRRMGLCSEVADGGENLEDHPRPREQIRLPQGPVSACKLPCKFAPGALNLFLSVQTKPCLGHCITRGISLRRQATILRLRGAVLFSGAGGGIRTRARG